MAMTANQKFEYAQVRWAGGDDKWVTHGVGTGPDLSAVGDDSLEMLNVMGQAGWVLATSRHLEDFRGEPTVEFTFGRPL